MNYITLEEYYRRQFSFVQHHKYSIVDLEQMLPFELDILNEMLIDWLEEQEQKKNGML